LTRTRALAFLLACGVAASAVTAAPLVQWGKAKRINVVMLEYRFVPDQLTLRHGVPYMLHLENRGKELHEFTAPEFFAASRLRDPGRLANGGKEVVVQPGATADIALVPQRTGHFDLSCADHDWAGMTGEIVVE
jgi:uncharacterized cupredoxin-like copper-binding protein